ncbi:hypothetical protein ACFC6L_09645 [Kitasatospora phosalacinea]|uniref:hypothetical protein n=1 Tax=Kitasatospora phosalacinea TaxID=2065 RepID=UPI0035D7F3F9
MSEHGGEHATGAGGRARHPAHTWWCAATWAVFAALTPWFPVLAAVGDLSGGVLVWSVLLLGGGSGVLLGAHLGRRGAWLPALLAVDAVAVLLLVETTCLTTLSDGIGSAVSEGVPAGLLFAALTVLPLAGGLLLGWAPLCARQLWRRCHPRRRLPALR